MKYIKINNWDKLQHYKDRKPKWVKLYIDIIDEYDEDGFPKKFYNLPDKAKLTLLLLICFRARFNKHVPYQNDSQLKKSLGISDLCLQPLINTGFINIDTEVVQNDTVPLSPEKEKEKEKEKETEKSRKYSRESTEYLISYSLFDLIRQRKPDFKKPNLEGPKGWANHVRLMIERDKRDPERIEQVIQFCQADEFWQNNILSTQKLRIQFDQLELKMNSVKSTREKSTAQKLKEAGY